MLVTTEDLSLSAVAEVLSCFQPLQGLERRQFPSEDGQEGLKEPT